jgi:hypothetical protein
VEEKATAAEYEFEAENEQEFEYEYGKAGLIPGLVVYGG